LRRKGDKAMTDSKVLKIENEKLLMEEAKKTLAFKLASLAQEKNPALTVREAAVVLHQSAKTVRNLISGKNRKITSYKTHEGVRIHLKEVEAYKKLRSEVRHADIFVARKIA
jgi:excisionase family DNA binding protein